MIRATQNVSISGSLKDKTTDPVTNYNGIIGQTLELVITNDGIGGGDVIEERSDSMVRVTGQTTTPSGEFNGTYE